MKYIYVFDQSDGKCKQIVLSTSYENLLRDSQAKDDEDGALEIIGEAAGVDILGNDWMLSNYGVEGQRV